ncbi:hypothetical protein, partial [Streptomyces roseicoloratus]|uniref:hypothetical protein n=1 Tax=Streptomyces roseicoloratus TaxID=2508722 RepID=UPI0013E9026E
RRADAAEQADTLITEATAEAERLTAEAEQLRVEAEQVRADGVAEADALRAAARADGEQVLDEARKAA